MSEEVVPDFHVIVDDRCALCERASKRVVIVPFTAHPELRLCAYCVLAMAHALAGSKKR